MADMAAGVPGLGLDVGLDVGLVGLAVGLDVGLDVGDTVVGDSVVADTGHEQPQSLCAPIAISCGFVVIWSQALPFLMAPHVILVYCTILTSSSVQPPTFEFVGACVDAVGDAVGLPVWAVEAVGLPVG